jgi:ribonuclease HII
LLVTTAAAATAAGGAARTFARFEHVIEEVLRDGCARERHDRIGEILAIVRLHPRLDRTAACRQDGKGDEPTPQQAIIRGDSYSLSFAAASILAKVTRDRHMIALHETYANYGFVQHKGYGTEKHLAAIQKHGPSPIHRRTFAPMRTTLL